jgi:hypothetical protein
MSEVMQTRTMILLRTSQANLPGHLIKRFVYCAVGQRSATIRHKKELAGLPAEKPVTSLGILYQYLLCRGVYRYQTGFAKLGTANGQYALL